MTIGRQIAVHLLILLGVLLLFEFTEIDIRLQDCFYLGDRQGWLIDYHDALPHFFFYRGIKVLLATLGVVCVVMLLLSWRSPRRDRFRRGCLLMLLSLVFVPAILSGSRNLTNIYCPRQLQRYGGDKPYVKLFEPRPKPSPRGRCFPAGHASGGFALMMAYFALDLRRHKRLGLAVGLTVGWVMGLYQMMNGAHFLSHTVASMSGAWIIILAIVGLAGHAPHRRDSVMTPGSDTTTGLVSL